MSDLTRRVGRLERTTTVAGRDAPAVDLPTVYRRLESIGLACWDPHKAYWSPTDPRKLQRLLCERQTR